MPREDPRERYLVQMAKYIARKERKYARMMARGYNARPEVRARKAEYNSRPEAKAKKAKHIAICRDQLHETYLRACNREKKGVEVDLLVRATSILTHRILKGEMCVEQANKILERLGSTARIPTTERAAE